MVRKTITTEKHGCPDGTLFDGRSSINDPETAFIQRLVIGHGDHVDALVIYYGGSSPSVCHIMSGTGGTSTEIVLKRDEFIATVTGMYYPNNTWVGNLSFVSNLGSRWGPFGTYSAGTSFTWDYYNIPSPPGARMGLLYLEGSFENHFSHLQATFAEHPFHSASEPVPEVKHEQQGSWEPVPGIPATLSPFARTLMSPVIVLQVGSTPVTFQASEDILCRLPFFRAALQGGFREATDKIVTMPDDEPALVASLLEFLYLGSYTYISNSAKDKDEASFHVSLHAIAGKYGCPALEEVERRSIGYVLDGLQGLDVMRVVKEMYERGWVAKDWSILKEFAAVKERIPGIISELYAAGGEELDSLWADCPGLAADLMRLMI